MKDARWRDFLQRGFFPAVTQRQLCFKRMTAFQALVDTASYDVLITKVLVPMVFSWGLAQHPGDSVLLSFWRVQHTDELLRLDGNGSPVFTIDMGHLITAHAHRMLDCPASLRQVRSTLSWYSSSFSGIYGLQGSTSLIFCLAQAGCQPRSHECSPGRGDE